MESAPFKPKNWMTSFAVLVTAVFLIGGCAPANNPPVITNLKAEPETVSPSGVCQIECVASDEDGDELSYEWLASEGHIDGDGAIVVWSTPESEGIYNIVVKVTDGNDGEASDSITIRVRDNRPPAITSLIADADWVTPSSSCQVTGNAEDPDGDELSYEWSTSGGDISGTGSVVTWTAPDAAGLYNITVVVTDGYGGEETRMLTVTVALNPPPVIESLIVTPKGHEYLKKDDGGYKVGKAMSCDIECVAFDSNGDELSYEWLASGDKIDGGEISGEGSIITWTAPDSAGEVTVTVTVSDAAGSMVSKSIVFRVVRCSSCTFK